MGEVVLKGVLSASAKVLLGTIASLIAQEVKFVWGFKADLKRLEKKLEPLVGMLAMLESSTDDTSNVNVVLNCWLKRVKVFLYDAEDVLDKYAYVLLKLKIRSNRAHIGLRFRKIWFKSKIRLYSSWSCNPLVIRIRTAHKVNGLMKVIDEMYVEADRLGIKPVKVASGGYYVANANANEDNILDLRRKYVSFDGMIGRDEDKAKLVNLVCNRTTHSLNVIGIHGMAGLGKTTLAKSVFETEEVKDYFNEKMFLVVSYDFKMKDLVDDMVQQLYQEKSSLTNDEAIKQKLQEKLRGKKYLLVLDDVWDTFVKVWEPLASLLQEIGGSKGTTILVTSRSKPVLKTLQITNTTGRKTDPCVYQLETLLEDESWNLFMQDMDDELYDSEKNAIAKRLMIKCGGVPLAIKALQGMLRMRKRIEDWREIEKSEIWNEVDDEILPSVKLSFKYLPNVWVKKCFAYCAIFKEDEVIEKERLIQLWMAQGFLRPYDKMEEMGEKYFNLLMGNSFFQDIRLYNGRGKESSCKMHDVLHALAQAISDEEIFLLSKKHNNFNREIKFVDEIQHLRVDYESELSFEIGNKLRTLYINDRTFKMLGKDLALNRQFKDVMPKARVNDWTSNIIGKVMSNAACLRSLSLVNIGLEKLPDSIGSLYHLRYLDVSHNYLRTLPSGLSKLYNLQTLRVFSNLRNICGDFVPKLMPEFCELINLRHLCGDQAMGIPLNLSKISGLQTIPPLDLTRVWGGKISELGKLTKLKGRLSLKGLIVVGVEEVRKVNLENIEELHLEWHYGKGGDNCDAELKLEALQPHSKLTSLRLTGYPCNEPSKWFREMIGHGGVPLSQLVDLRIDECSIQQLPSLNNLVSLKNLQIRSCANLESLGVLPPLTHLQSVTIMNCRNITGLPISILCFPSLLGLYLGPFSEVVEQFPFPMVKDDITYSSLLSKSPLSLGLHGYGMELVRSLPNQIQHIITLTELDISYFSCLEELPEWLGSLPSLRKLNLRGLPSLKCMPSQAALSHVQRLTVYECPQLKNQCMKDIGSDWSKIQHISYIRIDREIIQNS